jgi:hypothetical protein
MYTCNTVILLGDIKRMCERALGEEWRFKQETLKYIRSLMLSMKQEDLIIELDTLNYKELRMAVGVGVPGDAQQFARDKLKAMREKIRESTNASASFHWIDLNKKPADKEAVDGTGGVQTSKEG